MCLPGATDLIRKERFPGEGGWRGRVGGWWGGHFGRPIYIRPDSSNKCAGGRRRNTTRVIALSPQPGIPAPSRVSRAGKIELAENCSCLGNGGGRDGGEGGDELKKTRGREGGLGLLWFWQRLWAVSDSS